MAFQGNATCNVFKTALLNGGVDFTNDTFKIALYTESASLDETTVSYTTTGEASGGNYSAGGLTLTPTVSSSDGTSFVTFQNVAWQGVITARGALIYKDGDVAVCVLDFGSDKTSSTEFAIQFPPSSSTSAILRIQ